MLSAFGVSYLFLKINTKIWKFNYQNIVIDVSPEFVKKGDSWGNQPRDVLRLNYQVSFGTTTHALKDTIVLRDRGVKMETFNPFVY